MNSRILTPFLISFAVVAFAGGSRVKAQTGHVASSAVEQTLSQPSSNVSGAREGGVSTADENLRSVVLNSLSRDLAGHFNLEGDVELELLRPWIAPAGADTSDFTVAVSEYPTVLTSSLLIRVRYTSTGKTLREDSLSLRVQVWRDGWVARTPIERGGRFEPSSCDTRRVDMLRERDVVPAGVSGATEWTLVRMVPAGRLLTWRDITRRSLVRKGDVIEVAAIDGTLQVTMKALAMQDGAQGDTVRVRNLDSRREFAALVTAQNRAEVHF